MHLCINYTLRPEDAEKLIADLDAILEILTAIDLAQLGIDAFTGVNSLLAIAGGGIQFMSPAFIAMATGVTAGSAAAASATIMIKLELDTIRLLLIQRKIMAIQSHSFPCKFILP